MMVTQSSHIPGECWPCMGPGSRSSPCLRLLFGEELMPGVGTDSLVTKSNGEVKKVLGRKSALSLDKERGKNHH